MVTRSTIFHRTELFFDASPSVIKNSVKYMKL